MTGSSIFVSGVIVVGVAKFALAPTLFLLYRSIGASSRVAAIGVIVYLCNPNNLFFTSQYAYESLALPSLSW